jgi:hypothetical protein
MQVLGDRLAERKDKKVDSQKVTLLAVGDLILDMPDTESYFALSAPALKLADVVLGQGEIPYTKRGVDTYGEVPAPPADPENLKASPYAGFNVITIDQVKWPSYENRSETKAVAQSGNINPSGG